MFKKTKNDPGSGLRSVKNQLLIINVLLVLLGVFLIIFPDVSAEIICRITGVALTAFGLLRTVMYFARYNAETFGSFALVQGAALVGFGVLILVKPQLLAAFLTMVLAIVIIIGGIMKLQYGIDLLRLHVPMWWFGFAGALIMIVLGVIALLNPFSTAVTLMIFLGASLVADGIWDAVSIFYLSHELKKARKDEAVVVYTDSDVR